MAIAGLVRHFAFCFQIPFFPVRLLVTTAFSEGTEKRKINYSRKDAENC